MAIIKKIFSTPPLPSATFTTIGSVGTSGQINSGHQLVTSSFPSAAIGANLSWWMLNALTDGSGNGRTLTNNGATPLTGTDIFGATSNFSFTAASSQYLSSSGMGTTLDALFDPGPNDFAAGGWFNIPTYAASHMMFISQWNQTSSKCSFYLGSNVTYSGLLVVVSSDGIAANQQVIINYPYSSISSGYHHFAIRHIVSTKTFTLFIDGVAVVTGTYTGNLYAAGSGNRKFNIGSFDNGGVGQFLTGVCDKFFFYKGLLTDNDIMKIQSAKLSHNLNVPAINQNWLCQVQGNSQTRTLNSNDFVVDQTANDLYYDLSQEAPTAQACLRMTTLY